ncbi:hypothetical protein [Chitinivibrio alkaliphilus]|uniref:Uncharacterized protein n=1 Tax=Chitinivibrio alkaliphilus ACht1 TaxID=1313304 RepID=U7D730_9BACT|nr:hypothetical protein [Chitinivibrio alkaliphilus]ERP31356.1 hypothetical protein CALK_1701 [Chitinivibrio alkaliphilus ACht1]
MAIPDVSGVLQGAPRYHGGVTLAARGNRDGYFYVSLPAGGAARIPVARGSLTATGVFIAEDNLPFLERVPGESNSDLSVLQLLGRHFESDTERVVAMKTVIHDLSVMLEESGEVLPRELLSEAEQLRSALSYSQSSSELTRQFELFFPRLISYAVSIGGFEKTVLNALLKQVGPQQVYEGGLESDVSLVTAIVTTITARFPSLRGHITRKHIATSGGAFLSLSNQFPQLQSRGEMAAHIQAYLVQSTPVLLSCIHPHHVADTLIQHEIPFSPCFFTLLEKALVPYAGEEKPHCCAEALCTLFEYSRSDLDEARLEQVLQRAVSSLFTHRSLEEAFHDLHNCPPLTSTARESIVLSQGLEFFQQCIDSFLHGAHGVFPQQLLHTLGYYDSGLLKNEPSEAPPSIGVFLRALQPPMVSDTYEEFHRERVLFQEWLSGFYLFTRRYEPCTGECAWRFLLPPLKNNGFGITLLRRREKGGSGTSREGVLSFETEHVRMGRVAGEVFYTTRCVTAVVLRTAELATYRLLRQRIALLSRKLELLCGAVVPVHVKNWEESHEDVSGHTEYSVRV